MSKEIIYGLCLYKAIEKNMPSALIKYFSVSYGGITHYGGHGFTVYFDPDQYMKVYDLSMYDFADCIDRISEKFNQIEEEELIVSNRFFMIAIESIKGSI